MGKKLDAILGRTFKTSKFIPLAHLATSRLAVFKNQHQVRCNQARSDVLQLLQQGHHERALLRVEQVIKEQHLLDVYVMMEGYCNLLVERVHLIVQERVCPDELKEAVSSLFYASTRCGDFPELQEIRKVFTSWYGKEFAARSIELRNNCGVNPKMIQKLSTRQPNLDSRMKLLKEIASENNIVVQLEEASDTNEEKMEVSKKQNQHEHKMSTNSDSSKLVSPEEMEKVALNDSVKAKKNYRDVSDAAQAAFELAADAAAAARAAVELSRSEPHDPDNHNSPGNRGKKVTDKDESMKLESEQKNHVFHHGNEGKKLEANDSAEQKGLTSTATSNSGPTEEGLRVYSMSLDAEHLVEQLEKDIVLDESDDETHDLGSNIKSGKIKGEIKAAEKKIPSIIQAGLHREKGPISVRTRGLRGY
ncbi:uncharacterized protein LOC110631369 [Manihot esculenta]|uniref:Uncharacterized protein n=1 Tax=Manihot esculenta TaxID=3983 RepID=A0A2C9ULK6_MANES|nr:uncharacterized protein LOC110631369 [Manihot esculenta]OAY31293.1 hypothetical protein MANES_14G100200v8 [Manihot esculenta]